MIILRHYDDWWVLFSKAIQESNKRRVQRFSRNAKAVDSEIQVIVPEFFSNVMFWSSLKAACRTKCDSRQSV
jgi:hypothetical protein